MNKTFDEPSDASEQLNCIGFSFDVHELSPVLFQLKYIQKTSGRIYVDPIFRLMSQY